MAKNNFSKGLIWNAVGSAIESFLSLLYTLAVTRINGIDAAGIVSVCLSVSFIARTISLLGNRTYEVSDLTTDDDVYYSLKIFASKAAVVLAMIICLAFRYSFEKTFLILVLMCSRIIESFSDTIYAVFQKNERLDLVGKSYTLKNALAFTSFTAVDLLTKNIYISSIFILIATVVVYFMYDKRFLKNFKKLERQSFPAVSGLFNRMSSFIAFVFITILISNVPRLIADLFYSETEMGFFSIIFMIPSIMVLFGQFVIQPFLTQMTADANSGKNEAVNKTLLKMVAATTVVAALGAAAAWFLGVPVLSAVFGNDFSGYQGAMTLAVISGAFIVISTIFSTVLTVYKENRIQLFLYIGSVILESVLIYIGAASRLPINIIFLFYAISMAVQALSFAIVKSAKI